MKNINTEMVGKRTTWKSLLEKPLLIFIEGWDGNDS